MIKAEVTFPEKGSGKRTANVSVQVSYNDIRDALQEYTFLTAKLRDMLTEEMEKKGDEDGNPVAMLFTAFQIGAERLILSDDGETYYCAADNDYNGPVN